MSVFIPSVLSLAKESPQRLAEKLVRSGYVIEEHERYAKAMKKLLHAIYVQCNRTYRSINVLKKALDHQKKMSSSMSDKFQSELEQRMAQQRAEYEGTVKRHQTFIDQVQNC